MFVASATNAAAQIPDAFTGRWSRDPKTTCDDGAFTAEIARKKINFNYEEFCLVTKSETIVKDEALLLNARCQAYETERPNRYSSIRIMLAKNEKRTQLLVIYMNGLRSRVTTLEKRCPLR